MWNCRFLFLHVFTSFYLNFFVAASSLSCFQNCRSFSCSWRCCVVGFVRIVGLGRKDPRDRWVAGGRMGAGGQRTWEQSQKTIIGLAKVFAGEKRGQAFALWTEVVHSSVVRQHELRASNFQRMKCKSLRVHWPDSPDGTKTGTSSPTVLISSLWHLFWCGLPASNSEISCTARVQLAMYQTDKQTMLFVTLCAYPNSLTENIYCTKCI